MSLLSACGKAGGSGVDLNSLVAQAKTEGDAARATFTPAMKEAIAAAEAEGSVSLMSGSAQYTQAEQKVLAEALNAYFGTHLSVATNSIGSASVAYQQVLQSFKAGASPQVDLWVSSLDYNVLLGQQHALEAVDWAALGAKDSDVLTFEGTSSLYIQDYIRGLYYNTNAIDEASAPTTWDGLLAPQYKGKICTAAVPSIFPTIGLVIGHPEALSLVTKLVNDQGMKLLPSLSQVQQAVADGQCWIGFGGGTEPLSSQGAPLADAPLKIGAIPAGAVVMKNAPHAAAAKLLSYFLSETNAGGLIGYNILGWMKHTQPGTEIYDVAHKGGVAVAPLDFQQTVVPAWSPKFAKVLGVG
ncbi:ABC transporter substrate-binding protein [Amycolatopsis acidicola]|uniref:ABC transporter substrate-binding protein n=1 Tax=Amycolatopsis acidicola TaxID=2596893 RepID=UPI00140A91B4|nr:ABC transporter substrate-binding protein [Amycolatopsis acidicola]